MASDQPERASLCDIRLPHSSRGVWKRIPDELLWTGHPLGFTSGQVWWWVSHLDSEYLVMEGLLSSTPETEESVKEGNFSYTLEMLEFGYLCLENHELDLMFSTEQSSAPSLGDAQNSAPRQAKRRVSFP